MVASITSSARSNPCQLLEIEIESPSPIRFFLGDQSLRARALKLLGNALGRRGRLESAHHDRTTVQAGPFRERGADGAAANDADSFERQVAPVSEIV